MKRFFLMSTLLLVAMMMGAQTKVAPKMKKGMKKVYVTETTFNSEFSHPISISQETVFEVIDATNDGYILDVYVTDVKTDTDDAESRIYSLATEVLKGVHTKYATDKDGKVTGVLDAEDVAKRVEGMFDKLLSGLSLPAEMSVSNMKSQLKEQMNEDNLIQSLQVSASPLALNGKTISTGTEEEFLNQNNLKGLKMKRIYTVNDNGTISTSANLNMDSQGIQKLISGALDSLAPKAIDDNALAGLNSLFDKANLQCSEQSTYTFEKDGWVKNITSEMTTSAMGMSVSMKSNVKLK
jgi:hypothetical protein